MTEGEAWEMFSGVSEGRKARLIGTVTAADVLLASVPSVIYGPNYDRGIATAFVDVCRFSADKDLIRFDYWLGQLKTRVAGTLATEFPVPVEFAERMYAERHRG